MELNLEYSAEAAADGELKQRIVEALSRLHFPALRRLHISVREGVVTLNGRLGTFYEKQVAELYIRRVADVEKIVSRVEVAEKSGSPSQVVPRNAPRARRAPVRGNDSISIHWRRWGLGVGTLALLLVTAFGVRAYWGGIDRPALAPLTGHVSFDGQPAAGATVIFHPLEAPADAPRPTATVGTDGTFTLGTYQPGDGAPAGEYAVTVEWRKLVA